MRPTTSFSVARETFYCGSQNFKQFKNFFLVEFKNENKCLVITHLVVKNLFLLFLILLLECLQLPVCTLPHNNDPSYLHPFCLGNVFPSSLDLDVTFPPAPQCRSPCFVISIPNVNEGSELLNSSGILELHMQLTSFPQCFYNCHLSYLLKNCVPYLQRIPRLPFLFIHGFRKQRVT